MQVCHIILPKLAGIPLLCYSKPSLASLPLHPSSLTSWGFKWCRWTCQSNGLHGGPSARACWLLLSRSFLSFLRLKHRWTSQYGSQLETHVYDFLCMYGCWCGCWLSAFDVLLKLPGCLELRVENTSLRNCELWWTPHFENDFRSRILRCCTEAGSYKTLLKEADKEAELVFYMLHAIGIRKQWLIAQLGQT